MKRFAKTAVFAAATVGVVVSGTLISYANWISPPSTVTGKVRAGSMPKGVTPSAAIQSGHAVVSWSAQEIVSGVPMTAYVVTAHDTDATPLPDVARTVTATGSATESVTFTAAELAGGKWKWAIVPKFHSWTGDEGKLSSPKLVFPAPVRAAATPVKPAPTAVETTTPAPEKTPAAPTTSAPDTPAEPANTEDPTPSDSPREPAPSPSSSASQ